jgi:hypothetical protein
MDDSELEFFPSLVSITTDLISRNLTVETALDTYMRADHLMLDELKVNTLKFIALNIVSFLESCHFERLIGMPVYLIRELENFLKVKDIDKFRFFAMEPFEENVQLALES